MDEDYLARLEV